MSFLVKKKRNFNKIVIYQRNLFEQSLNFSYRCKNVPCGASLSKYYLAISFTTAKALSVLGKPM